MAKNISLGKQPRVPTATPNLKLGMGQAGKEDCNRERGLSAAI